MRRPEGFGVQKPVCCSQMCDAHLKDAGSLGPGMLAAQTSGQRQHSQKSLPANTSSKWGQSRDSRGPFVSASIRSSTGMRWAAHGFHQQKLERQASVDKVSVPWHLGTFDMLQVPGAEQWGTMEIIDSIIRLLE